MGKNVTLESSISEIIFKKLCGTISPSEQKRLDGWLSQSDAHRSMYQEILDTEDITSAYRQWEDIDVDHRWHQFRSRYITSARSRLLWTVRVAAVAALAVVVALTVTRRPQRRVVRPPVAVSLTVENAIKSSSLAGRNTARMVFGGKTVNVTGRQSDSILTAVMGGEPTNCEVITEKSKEFWMSLPDGSRIHLDGGSRIAYTSEFGTSTRTLYLRGNAYFFIAHDDKLPFIVKTDHGDIRDFGTQFVVDAGSSGTTVALVSGSVGITSSAGIECMLKPNQKADISVRGEVNVGTCDVRQYIAWNEGRYVFDDLRLDKLFKVIDKWYGCHTAFDSPELQGIHVTGNFDRYKDIDDILNAITIVGHVEARRDGNSIYIGKRKQEQEKKAESK